MGQQSGDPAKLAQALIEIANLDTPPLRFLAGAYAVETAEQVASTIKDQANAFRKLSNEMAFDR